MTTDTVTRSPRHMTRQWRRRQALIKASEMARRNATPRQARRNAMAQVSAAADTVRAAVARAVRRGDWSAIGVVVTALTQLARDIDRRGTR